MDDWKSKHRSGQTLQFLGVILFIIILIAGLSSLANSYNPSPSAGIGYTILAMVVSTPIMYLGDRKIRAANRERLIQNAPFFEDKRPKGVIIFAIVFVAYGIGTIVEGVSRANYVTEYPFLGPLLMQIELFREMISAYVIFVIILGLFYFIIAGSLFTGKNWARELIRLVAILGGLISFLTIIFGNLAGILYLLGYWAIYWYMGRKNVEEYFFFHSQPPLKENVKNHDVKQGSVSHWSPMGKSEAELKSRLSEIKEELIEEKITEAEYKRLKQHIEVELSYLNSEKDYDRSPVK